MSNSTSSDRQSQEQVRFGNPNRNFFIGSNQAARDPRLKPSAFKLLCWIATHDDNYVTTYRTISKQMDMSTSTLRNAFALLEELGYLHQVRSKKKNGSNAPNKKNINWNPPVDNIDKCVAEIATPCSENRNVGVAEIATYKNNNIKKEKNKEELTPPVNKLFKDEGDEKIYRNNAKNSWMLNGLDQLFAELWDMTPKYDASDWQLKDHIASFVRTLKKIPESELLSNKEKIRASYKQHLEAHLELKQNRDLYDGRSGFSNITEWFKQQCWKEDVAEAMNMLTMETLKAKPKTQYNARTGREEAPQDRTKVLDRYDYTELDKIHNQFAGADKKVIENALRKFCQYWSKNFEYVVSIFYSRYAQAEIPNQNQARENHGRLETRNAGPRAFNELLA